MLCFAAGLLAALPNLGCGGRESFEETIAGCALLPGAKASENSALVAEVEAIERDKQTPLQLVRLLPDPGENAAAIISEALSDGARMRLFPRLDGLIPDERFAFDSAGLGQAQDLINGAVLMRGQLEKAEAAPACEFDVRHDQGFFAGMRFLDDAAIAARLRLLEAAPAIARDDLGAACKAVELGLAWIDRLAAVPRIEARLLAGQLRGEALSVIEAIADDRLAQTADLEQLYAALRRSLDAWPDEAAPLIGDRAVTMHAYEAIRAGMFERLVTTGEQQMLEHHGQLERLRSLTPEAIDRDQLAYLEGMRELIESASLPLHKRAEAIDEVAERLASDGPAAQTAPLAAYLFFPGIPKAIRQIASDRAACEAWAIALAAAGELDLPPYKRNPVTGVEYEVERLDGALIVRLGDPELRDAYARVP